MSCNTIVPILFIMIAIGAFGLLIQTVGNDYSSGIIPWKTAAILQGAFVMTPPSYNLHTPHHIIVLSL